MVTLLSTCKDINTKTKIIYVYIILLRKFGQIKILRGENLFWHEEKGLIISKYGHKHEWNRKIGIRFAQNW